MDRWSGRSVELLKSDNAATRQEACATLRNLSATNAVLGRAIVAAGALPLLISIVETGTTRAQEEAAGTMKNLMFNNPDNQQALVDAQGLCAIVELLRSEEGEEGEEGGAAARPRPSRTPEQVMARERTLEQATGTLRTLAQSAPEFRKAIIAAGALPLLKQVMDTTTCERVQEHAAGTVRNLVIKSRENERLVIYSGIIPQIVALLTSDAVPVQEQAAGCLRNLVMSNIAEHERVIMAAGAMDPLLQLLHHGEAEVQVQAAGAVTQLVDRLVEQLGSDDVSMQLQSTDALVVLGALGEDRRRAILEEGGGEALVECIRNRNPAVAAAAGAVLRVLTSEETSTKKAIWDLGILQPLREMLAGEPGEAGAAKQAEAANVMNNFMLEGHLYELEIVKTGAAGHLVEMLESEYPKTRESAMAALRILSETFPEHRQIVVADGLFNFLPGVLADQYAQCETTFPSALRLLRNLTRTSDYYKDIQKAEGIVPVLQQLADVDEPEPDPTEEDRPETLKESSTQILLAMGYAV